MLPDPSLGPLCGQRVSPSLGQGPCRGADLLSSEPRGLVCLAGLSSALAFPLDLGARPLCRRLRGRGCGARGGFLPRHDEDLREPLVRRQGSPPSLGFSRQEHWSGLPFPSEGDLPNPGIEPRSPALQADFICSGGLRPLVELCVEPAGLCGRCTGVAVPLRVVPSCPGLRPPGGGPGLPSRARRGPWRPPPAHGQFSSPFLLGRDSNQEDEMAGWHH